MAVKVHHLQLGGHPLLLDSPLELPLKTGEAPRFNPYSTQSLSYTHNMYAYVNIAQCREPPSTPFSIQGH